MERETAVSSTTTAMTDRGQPVEATAFSGISSSISPSEVTTAAAVEQSLIMTTVGEKLAPFNPTNNEAIDIALEMQQVVDNDVLYDLGCGDARYLVRACSKNPTLRGVGIEYDRDVYKKACTNVEQSNTGSQITLHHDNVLNIDFTEATVIFVYLVPEGILKIRDALVNAIERGARVVTYVFSIKDVVPTRVELYKKSTKLYLYRKPS